MTKPLRQPACHARHERAGIVTRGSVPGEHVLLGDMKNLSNLNNIKE